VKYAGGEKRTYTYHVNLLKMPAAADEARQARQSGDRPSCSTCMNDASQVSTRKLAPLEWCFWVAKR